MQRLIKFRLIFMLALLIQLVVFPLQTMAVNTTDTEPPTWGMPINYVALGDSLAYGIGSDGLPGKGYPDYLAEKLHGKHSLAFSNKGFSYPGYTAADVLKDLQNNISKTGNGIGYDGQTLELHQAIADANFITISAGANDVLKYFTINPDTGVPTIETSKLLGALQQISNNYHEILTPIYQINPNVQIYIMEYYNPFPHLDSQYQAQIDLLLTQLNRSIQKGMEGTEAVFVPTKDAIAKNVSTYLPNPENIHLSVQGYKVVAQQFDNQLQENYQWFPKNTLTAIVKDKTTVSLTWQSAIDNDAVTGYRIYNGTEKIAQVNGDTRTFDIKNLTESQTYTFTVSAIDEANNESIVNPKTTVTLESGQILFSDIEKHWAKTYIEQAAAMKIVNGYSDGTFKPQNQLTRTQATSIIVRALNLKTNEAAPFKDIGGYAMETQAEIAAAYQYGIVKGFDGNFNPGKPVTRSQLALMIKRAYEFINEDPYTVTEFAPFPDITHLDLETQTAITLLYNLEFVSGSDGKYLPGTPTSRAHAAKIFVNYMNHLEGEASFMEKAQ